MSMSRAALGILRPRGRGGVIANFGSLGSWTGGPAFGYYGATKWAVSGFTESLRAEVGPLGIDAVVVEPGYFRTGFLNAGGAGSAGAARVRMARAMEEEYAGTGVPTVRAMLDQADNAQPGDVAKAARVIVDVLTGTGCAAGKGDGSGRPPMRLLLGRDAWGTVKDKMEGTEKLMSEWEDVILSTDHDDVKA
jgi:NAD(P)-dependent dehydrogenase (short-subunit alcohol dehydrogenase family)